MLLIDIFKNDIKLSFLCQLSEYETQKYEKKKKILKTDYQNNSITSFAL